MADNKVQITIEVDAAKGTANIKGLQDSFGQLQGKANALGKEYDVLTGRTLRAGEATQKVRPAAQEAVDGIDRLKASMGVATAAVGALAAAWGAWVIGDYLKDAALLNARIETLGVVLQTVGRNAYYSQTELTGYVDTVKKMGITNVEAHQSVISMIQANLDLADASKLARVAQDAAVIGNTNSSESLKGMLHGITTLQPEILRTYGIIVNFESEYAKYAATVGRTTTSLSGAEKQHIALNAVLKAGERISGTYEAAMGTAGKQITSFARYTEELKEAVGKAFGPATSSLIESATQSVKAFRVQAENPATQESLRALADLTGRFAVAAGQNLPTALNAASLVLRTFATGIVVTYGGLEILGRSLGNTAAGLAQMAEGNFRQGWDTWTQDTTDGLAQMEKIADRVNRIWASSTAAVKQASAATEAETKTIEQWDEGLRRMVRQSALQAEEAQRKTNEALKRRMEDDQKALEQWEKTRETIGQSATEKELTQLRRQYDAYNRVVQDKVALEQWWANEKAAIETKAASEAMALYEELYKNTGHQDYANAAIDAMKTVLDSQEETWAAILGSEQDARTLRLKREDDYAAKVKALLGDIVDATVQAESARTDAVSSGVDARLDAEKSYANAAVSQPSPSYQGGASTVQTYDVVYNRVFINAREEALQFQEEILNVFQEAEQKKQAAQAEAVRLAEEQAEMAQKQADAIARATREAQEMADAIARIDFRAIANTGRLDNFSGFGSTISAALSALGLGQAEKDLRLSELTAFFETPTNFEAYNAESVLDKYLEYITLTFDTYAAEIDAREDLLSILTREQDFRSRMLLSDLSPVQSSEAYTTRYNELLAVAGNSSADYDAFTSYLESTYLPFMKSYTDGQQSYREIWDGLFGEGGVLESISTPIKDQENGGGRSLDDIRDEGLQRLIDLAGMVDNGGSLYELLSDSAKAQAEYSVNFLNAMSDSLTEAQAQGTNLKNIDAYTLGTKQNTVLLQNLVKYIGKTEAYEVGGSYYNAAQVDQLAQSAKATGSYFQLASGGEYYQTVPSTWSKTTLTPDPETGSFTEDIASPVAALSIPAYYSAATGKHYDKNTVDSMLSNSLTLWSNVLGFVNDDTTPDMDSRIYATLTNAYARQDQLSTPQMVDMAWQSGASGTKADFLYYPVGSENPVRRWSHDTPRNVGNGKAVIFGAGGLTQGVSIAGERGPEWVVPTYEPERSRFLAAVPSEFWSDVLPFVPDAPQQASSTDGYVKRGPEWVVPTYEPERSRFLAAVPSEFWSDVLPFVPATETRFPLAATSRDVAPLPALLADERTFAIDVTGVSGSTAPRPPENRLADPDFTGLFGSGMRTSAPSIDPEAIGRAVARAILAAGEEGSREIHIHLSLDGREISHAVADGFRRGDADLVTQARRRMAS